ncbi:MAG TPA: hypothetical protein VHM72_01275 [Solirubrobacteraceae bacterium]|nr:hypothetical protein [Solirubrobacteraceae bacterium]
MSAVLSGREVHVGAVRGRYFRENFAQGGIDLSQIVPELVTNADAAIAGGGRGRGRIELTIGSPDPRFLARWSEQMRALRVPALRSWRFEIRCGDDPYAYLHVHDHDAPGRPAGSVVTVPLATERLPADGRLRTLVSQLVQLRPVLEDPERELWIELPSGQLEIVRFPAPEPDETRPVLFDQDVKVTGEITARVTVRRSARPLSPGTSRATRLGGLVVRSGRAAHESTLGSHEGHPGARHLYGEIRCDALETLQRQALDRPRPQLVVKVDRSGLNDNHPVVKALYEAIDRVLRPILAEEEKRAGAHLIRPGSALKARDQVGLRALNDALKNAFDTPGKAAFEPGDQAATKPPTITDELAEPEPEPDEQPPSEPQSREREPASLAPLRFKQTLVRLHPGERRGVSLLADPDRIPAGTPVNVAVDPGLAINLSTDTVPAPVRAGWSRIDANLRARVSCEPGAKLTVLAEAAGQIAELVVLVVRHHASGWVREIARKDEDSQIEASFDPEAGIVTVYEGRREFKALERAARKAGLPKSRVREYLPYRMLEVEVAANAVYNWAAQQILARRLTEERPNDPIQYAASVHHEAQALRYRAHEKLMRAFLDEEVFDGQVRVGPEPRRRLRAQASLLEDQ